MASKYGFLLVGLCLLVLTVSANSTFIYETTPYSSIEARLALVTLLLAFALLLLLIFNDSPTDLYGVSIGAGFVFALIGSLSTQFEIFFVAFPAITIIVYLFLRWCKERISCTFQAQQ